MAPFLVLEEPSYVLAELALNFRSHAPAAAERSRMK